MSDRFFEWSLDHPWWFLVLFYVVWLGMVGGLLYLLWAPIGIGWIAGGVVNSLGLVRQNLRLLRDHPEWYDR